MKAKLFVACFKAGKYLLKPSIFLTFVFGLGQAGGKYVDYQTTLSPRGGNFLAKNKMPPTSRIPLTVVCLTVFFIVNIPLLFSPASNIFCNNHQKAVSSIISECIAL